MDLTTLVPEMMIATTEGPAAENVTEHVMNATRSHGGAHLAPFSILFKVIYCFGIIGNATAIFALRRGEKRVRNRKHLLLLTSLAANDLVALVGMLVAMVVSEAVPAAQQTRAFCAARVVLRVFGIGSVCIAVTMALERYLALTRPFLYQKQVTYFVIRMALLVSWLWAAVLTCAPVLGVGLYYDDHQKCCKRYRVATDSTDFAYAVVYVIFGTFLCLVLVYCNLAVIRALYAITAPRGGSQPAVRRFSRNNSRARALNAASDAPPHHNAATAEEVAFSRLMATLSVLFMICWLPNMVTSALYLTLGPAGWARLTPLAMLSDVLMLLNYVLNPVLYVLMRRSRRLSLLALCLKRPEDKLNESTKTSYPHETMLVSDNSAAEMKPLRAPPT